MKRRIITNSLIICFVLFSLLAGCKARPQIYNHSQAFIILNKAEGIFCDFRDGGAIQLSYKLKEDYPALSVLKEISNHLEGAGWRPLKENYLNPGLPSSHVKGWSDFEEATRWMGAWEDKYGNIVTYIFSYEYPKNKKKNLSSLQISAIYEPASLVALIKQELKKQKQ